MMDEYAGADEVDFDEGSNECGDDGDDDSGAGGIAEMGSGDEGRDEERHTRREIEGQDGNDVSQNEKAYGHLGFPIWHDGFFVNGWSSDSGDVRAGEEGNGPPGGFGEDGIGVARGTEMGMQAIEQYAEGCSNAGENEHGSAHAWKVEIHGRLVGKGLVVIADEAPAFIGGIAEPTFHGADEIAYVIIGTGIGGFAQGFVDDFDVFGADPTGAGKIIGGGDFYGQAAPFEFVEFEGDVHFGEGGVDGAEFG